MHGTKIVGLVILVGMLGHITELKKHATEKRLVRHAGRSRLYFVVWVYWFINGIELRRSDHENSV